MNLPFDSGFNRAAPRARAASRQRPPNIANARRTEVAALRQARRLLDGAGAADALALQTITAGDIRDSRLLAAATDPPQE